MMKFKRIAAMLALAPLMAATGTARAESASFTVHAGGDATSINGFVLGVGQSVATWQFSDALSSVPYGIHASVTSVAPGFASDSYPSSEGVQVDMPLRRIDGVFDVDTASASIQRIGFAGGIRFDVSGVLPNGRKNVASMGGSLTLSDLMIDFVNQGIYGTLEGGNNVGILYDQLLLKYWSSWDVQSLAPIACDNSGGGLGIGACSSLTGAGIRVSGLTVTSEAFDLISASLGLTPFGKSSVASVNDYGTITISPVPEASSSWLMLTGIVALGAAARRKRTNT